jgi:hypothetical protein
MPKRYEIWDKQKTLYAPDGSEWTKERIEQQYVWIKNPEAKAIITKGIISMSVFMEYENTKDFYRRLGLPITDEMTIDQVLDAIEYHEDHPKVETSLEERTAAALEALVMLGMPDVTGE